MKMVCDWLTDRLDLSLHPYQLTCIMAISRVTQIIIWTCRVFINYRF